MSRRQRLSHAVTLVEALVVVLLFAIVAGLAYQSAWRGAEKTRIKTAWSILRLIDAAQRAWERDNLGGFTDLTTLIDNGYLDDPNVGQSDWSYSASTTRAQALRNGGSCDGKALRRYYSGPFDGKEEETLLACP